MLKSEKDHLQSVSRHCDPQLKIAERLLGFGEHLADNLCSKMTDEQFDPVTANVISSILGQSLRRFRAGVLVWNHAYFAEAEILTRSLFESHLAFRFVIETQTPKSNWSKELTKEFGKLCDLCGNPVSRFTDMNFRARLYAANRRLKLAAKAENLQKDPRNAGVFKEGFDDKVNEDKEECEREFGKEWVSRIQSKKNFHGFNSVKLLAEYCGADKAHYYDTLYSLQSTETHSANAIGLLAEREISSALLTLTALCAILGETLEDAIRVFQLRTNGEMHEIAQDILKKFPH